MKRTLTLIFILCIHYLASGQISKEQILSDIDQLEMLIDTKHVSPFWITPEEEFRSVVENARLTVAEKESCDESCYVELFKIVSAVKDGHSAISGGSRYDLFGYLPLSLRWFDQELRVMRTSEKHKDILGYKIEKVNGKEIGEVLEELRPVVPHANDSRFRKFAGSYLHLPGLLYGLGITESPKSTMITFSNGDDVVEIEFSNLPPEEEETTRFVSFLDGKDNLPWYQRDNELYYWFDYDPKKEIMYFQYNRVGSMKSESSTQFRERLWKAVDSVEISKFVLDMRYNGGGNAAFSIGYVQGLLDRLDINKRGRLFVITGYDTFSAAVQMLNLLEVKSEAIILGEPPCGQPANPGDAEDHVLENTGLKILLSSLYHPSIFPDDQRRNFILDEEIVTTWDDYEAGEDPIMEYIRDFKDTKDPAATGYEEFLGKYEYSRTRNLELKEIDGVFRMEISRALNTPLYPSGDNRFATEVQGLELRLEDGQVSVDFPDGSSSTFSRIEDSSMSPVEYLYAGDVTKAEELYKVIKKEDPDFIELKDHRMSFLTTEAYFELAKYPDVDAVGIAREILNLGILLNDGNAPFCQYSLRFYQ